MKTNISMKRAFILLWHGLKAIIVGIANWIVELFGMRDGSKYGKILRRIVGSCFAFVMLLIAIAVGSEFCRSVYSWWSNRYDSDEQCYSQRHVSENVSYWYDEYGYGSGYLETVSGKKTIKGISWIATPLGTDSLVCYSNGKKRGYFNKFTGEAVIEPKYNHAWIFSDGVAAVEDDGWIKFIDASGKEVFSPGISYKSGDDYVFHNKHLVAFNDRAGAYGLIDTKGDWALKPEYSSIENNKDYWLLYKTDSMSVVNSEFQTVIPFVKGRIWVGDKDITVIKDNHVAQLYAKNGDVIEDFCISGVNCLTYDTNELRYDTTKLYNDDGTLFSETKDDEPTIVKKMAKCRSYESEIGWYGLISTEGKIITTPMYSSIEAIGYDTYLCKFYDSTGVILNGKGERIK